LANGNLLSAVVILLIVNLLCVAFSSELGVSNIGDVVVNALFDKDSLSTSNIELNEDLNNGIQKELNAEVETTGLLGFVDALQKVFSFIITLITLGFALLNMLIQTGAPTLLTSLIGLPFAIAFYISVVSAIRGFSI